jgi:serine/threonine-protein kinase
VSGGVAKEARLVGGRYELEALIGRGGIGEVWRARHVALKTNVALKFLQMASAQKESAKRRFLTEAQITAQLKTPNAVQVFDFGFTEEEQPYIVMELLEGETLGHRLERVKRMSLPETVRLLGQAARALHRAHALGIVHRDFKPDNIVIYEDDEGREQVKVLDFGVAKLVGALEEDGDAGEGEGPTSVKSFTRTGTVLGTPLYMAPEQVRSAADVDLKADIWAFGVVAYECLTGRPPFTGTSVAELFENIRLAAHPSAHFLVPEVPPAFDLWFDIACSPDRTRRFGTASIAWKRLQLVLTGVEAGDSTGSFSGGDSIPIRDAHEVSGERRVVVVSKEGHADASAPTLEGKAGELLSRSSNSELLSRSQNSELGTLRRIPVTRRSERPPPPPAAAAAAGDERQAPPADPSRRWVSWAAPTLAIAALGILTVWWTSRPYPAEHAEPSSVGVTAPSGASVVVAPLTRPAESTSPVQPVAPPRETSASSVASTVASSQPAASGPRKAMQAPTTSTRAAPPPVAAATATSSPEVVASPAVAPSPSPTPAPPPTAPPPDPGSYR